MTKRCLPTGITLALAMALPFPLSAQTVDYRGIIEAAPAASILIGEPLEQSLGRDYPFHITLQVPNPETGATLAAIFPEETDEAIAEFIYHVGGERLLEFNMLSYATISEGSEEERLQFIYNVIEGQVFPSLGAPADANVLGGRVASVGPHAAVEFIVVYETEDLGLTTGRIVGIVPPSGPYVPIYIQRTALERLGITDVNELSGTFGGEILSSLSFQARRDDTGEMVPF